MDKKIIDNLALFSAAFAGVYMLLWVLAGILTHDGYGLDVVEGLVWGREWLLGTHKHPPLPPWILEIVWQSAGDVGIEMILPLFQVLTLGVIYLLSKEFVSTEKALLSTLLVGICFVWRSFDNVFNHNTAQPFFWVAVIYLFYLALRDNRVRYWILLAVSAAACLWIKYSAIFLLIFIPLWLLFDKDARSYLKRAGPWISLVIFLCLIAPHIYFLVENNFSPIEYFTERANRGRNTLSFLLTQLLTQAPLILILALAGFIGKGCLSFQQPVSREDKFILCFAFAPLILLVLSSSIVGQNLHTQWGYSFFPLMGLAAMKFLGGRFDEIKFKRAFYALLFLMIVSPLAHGAFVLVRPHFDFTPSKLHYPQKQLAHAIESRFEKATGKKLQLLAGRVDIAGRATINMKPRPQFLYHGKWKSSPWVDKSKACQATAIVLEVHRSFSPYRDILRHCQAINSKKINFQVPFPAYPQRKPLNLNMVIIAQD